ncbi:hypothetical protein [Halotalea alkalilenta]|uniref:hypothetical protein n=1 Tax=Halotalea alkalilenta TaxID=376489 RepID=UPI003F8BE6CF
MQWGKTSRQNIEASYDHTFVRSFLTMFTVVVETHTENDEGDQREYDTLAVLNSWRNDGFRWGLRSVDRTSTAWLSATYIAVGLP